MKEDFDHIAVEYDQDFTHSPIGIAQRNSVYEVLNQCVSNFETLSVLEINCGTGEDALYFANKNATVCATDISTEMIKQAKIKQGGKANLTFETLDINKLDQFKPKETYDMIFSNFGGLNCLDSQELTLFLKNSYSKLNNEGFLFLVIMPRACVWESLYFVSMLKFKKAFRRKNKKGVLANVDGEWVKTYYYNPKDIVKIAKGFQLKKAAPIGLFVPPSYLNPFFKNREKWLSKLIIKDKKALKKGRYSSYSDHYVICLQKKS